MAGTEKKNSTKFQIINYIINHKATSKVELSRNLNLSMPTVLSNVNELLASGIAVEMGEYESTGGRKAKMISINPAYRYAVGIRITAKHVEFVLVNLKSLNANVLDIKGLKCTFPSFTSVIPSI
jgi:predicted transcriptional regulator